MESDDDGETILVVIEQHWKAVEYEYEMYFEARTKRRLPNLDRFHKSAYVELQLLHARILIDFFVKVPTPKGNDADALSIGALMPLVPTTLMTAVCDLKVAYGGKKIETAPRNEINKRIAHLTVERGERYPYGPVFRAIERPLEKVLKLFADVSPQWTKLREFAHNLDVAEPDSGEGTTDTAGSSAGASPAIPLNGPIG